MKKIFSIFLIMFALFVLQTSIFAAPAVNPDPEGLMKYAKSIPEYGVTDQTVDQLEPAILSMYGVRLFAEGNKDEAIYWYWLGLMRQQVLIADPVDRYIMLPDEMIHRFYREGGYRGNLLIRSTAKSYTGTMDSSGITLFFSLEVPNRYVLFKFSYKLDVAYFKKYETENVDRFAGILNQVLQHEKEHPFDPTKLIGYSSSFSGDSWKSKHDDTFQKFAKLPSMITENKIEIEQKSKENFFGPIFEIKIDSKDGSLIITPEKDQIYFTIDA